MLRSISQPTTGVKLNCTAAIQATTSPAVVVGIPRISCRYTMSKGSVSPLPKAENARPTSRRFRLTGTRRGYDRGPHPVVEVSFQVNRSTAATRTLHGWANVCPPTTATGVAVRWSLTMPSPSVP